jgi:hypothetical protein
MSAFFSGGPLRPTESKPKKDLTAQYAKQQVVVLNLSYLQA